MFSAAFVDVFLCLAWAARRRLILGKSLFCYDPKTNESKNKTKKKKLNLWSTVGSPMAWDPISWMIFDDFGPKKWVISSIRDWVASSNLQEGE